jgi:hypothetical protein
VGLCAEDVPVWSAAAASFERDLASASGKEIRIAGRNEHAGEKKLQRVDRACQVQITILFDARFMLS